MDSPKSITIVNGPWRQNCYVVYYECPDARSNCVIIDPGSDFEAIQKCLQDNNLRPLAIINTHGHFDHIGAVSRLVEVYDIPFYLAQGDKKLVKQANVYRLIFNAETAIQIPDYDREISDQDSVISLSEFEFEILPTPGHTAGSVCIKIGDLLYTGDTLLPSGPGRTDLPGARKSQMESSVEKLRLLDDGLLVYPGHGKPQYLKDIWTKYDQR